jgi:hypothetical protein
MSAVFAASYPLPPDRRSAFLEACARALASLPEGIDDGSLYRTITHVQKRFYIPPIESHHGHVRGVGKYAR